MTVIPGDPPVALDPDLTKWLSTYSEDATVRPRLRSEVAPGGGGVVDVFQANLAGVADAFSQSGPIDIGSGNFGVVVIPTEAPGLALATFFLTALFGDGTAGAAGDPIRVSFPVMLALTPYAGASSFVITSSWAGMIAGAEAAGQIVQAIPSGEVYLVDSQLRAVTDAVAPGDFLHSNVTAILALG